MKAKYEDDLKQFHNHFVAITTGEKEMRDFILPNIEM